MAMQRVKDIFIGKNLLGKMENNGAEYQRKAVVLLSAYFIGIVVLSFFSIINLIRNDTVQTIINAGVLFVVISGYLLFRASGSVVLASYIFVIIISMQLLTDTSNNIYRVMWSYCLPLLAFFILGIRQGLLLVSIYFAAIMIYIFGFKTAIYPVDFRIRYPIIYLSIAFFSYYFEKRRLMAYNELEKVSARNNAILMSIPDIIAEVDVDRNYTWMNQTGKVFFGEDAIGKPASAYFIGEQSVYTDVDPVFKGDEKIIYVESWQRRKDGEKRLLAWWCRALKDAKGNVTGALSTAKDITDTKKMEEQLHQSQKMAAIGQLAGGVAHEINNPLTVILGFSQRILKAGELPLPLKDQMDLIVKASQRCKDLVQNLLEFSRSGNYIMEPLNISNEIDMGLAFLGSKISDAGVNLEKQIYSNIPDIQARKHALEQVIVNLCGNAVDAMPDGGTLTVTAAVVEKNVIIKVIDTGIGISDENQKRIFEPFFTTKEVGKGTGLGLSLCYETVKKHGWKIAVNSRLKEGSVFTLTIPVK